MAMEMKLQMRLSQQLIMTPQLQQAIKLLQLSRTELEELIDQALIENPVLEEGMDIDTFPSEEDESYNETESPEMFEGPEPFESAKETQKEEASDELDWQQQYLEFSSNQGEGRRNNSDDEYPSLEATLAQGRSLADHLMWQLDMLKLDPLEHEIGVYLIGNIEEDGYLTISIRDLLENTPELREAIDEWLTNHPEEELPEVDPKVFEMKFQDGKPGSDIPVSPLPPVFDEEDLDDEDLEAEDDDEESPPLPSLPAERPKGQPIPLPVGAMIERVIQRLHSFDPAGVAARSLQECLLIQLRLLEMEGDLSYLMILEDMSLLECKDLKKIARRHKESIERVVEAYKLIMSLEPKPGRSYASTPSHQYIIPDVYIYKASNNEYKVALNEHGVPRLRISSYYKTLVDRIGEDSTLTKEYIHEKIKAGQWLMRSIEQRQKTIYRVTQSILKFQYEFFEKGIHYLKPLVLKDVAEDISVHESTVSRITTNKYVHTPQGIFELKYFFTSGIDQGEGGEAISSKRIKDMIEQLIQHEDLKNPYTDLQIAKILYEKSKIRVARRTVAKYREALNILPSNKRKQLF